MLNSSISLISDVLGNDAENAATIYGIYSFFEKIVNGLAVERVVNLFTSPETSEELKYIVAFTPLTCAILAFILTWLGFKFFSHKMAKITGFTA